MAGSLAAMRLLALPDVLCPSWYIDAVQRLHADLVKVRDLLTGPQDSIRLVLTPETVAVAEARRALTTLRVAFGLDQQAHRPDIAGADDAQESAG